MFRKTQKQFNRKCKSGHTDKIIRDVYWFLFFPIYIDDKIIGTNR